MLVFRFRDEFQKKFTNVSGRVIVFLQVLARVLLGASILLYKELEIYNFLLCHTKPTAKLQ